MRHPEQNIALLLIFAVILWALYFLFRYFTDVQYADRQERRLQFYVVFSSVHLITACLLLANDIIAWYRDYFFMYVWPMEHRFSSQIVVGYLVLALTGHIMALLMIHRDLDERWLPGPAALLSVTCLAVAGSTFSIYYSFGYCCETPMAVYSGFPFSIMRAYALPNNVDRQLSLIDIFSQYGSALVWEPRILRLFYDFLFWGSAATILLVGFNRLFRKDKM